MVPAISTSRARGKTHTGLMHQSFTSFTNVKLKVVGRLARLKVEMASPKDVPG
jgi:hypothetical protein